MDSYLLHYQGSPEKSSVKENRQKLKRPRHILFKEKKNCNRDLDIELGLIQNTTRTSGDLLPRSKWRGGAALVDGKLLRRVIKSLGAILTEGR